MYYALHEIPHLKDEDGKQEQLQQNTVSASVIVYNSHVYNTLASE